MKSNIVIYRSQDGLTKIDVRLENETVWLTQMQMSRLFGRDRSDITKHIRNIFSEGELNEKSNVQILHGVNSDKPVSFDNEQAVEKANGEYDKYRSIQADELTEVEKAYRQTLKDMQKRLKNGGAEE